MNLLFEPAGTARLLHEALVLYLDERPSRLLVVRFKEARDVVSQDKTASVYDLPDTLDESPRKIGFCRLSRSKRAFLMKTSGAWYSAPRKAMSDLLNRYRVSAPLARIPETPEGNHEP